MRIRNVTYFVLDFFLKFFWFAGVVLRPQAAGGQQVCERNLVQALAPFPAPAGLPLQV